MFALSTPGKTSTAQRDFVLRLPRKAVLAVAILSIASVGVVAGLAYAPGSPGFPYLSPTYQAQKAPFQYQGATPIAGLYEVWYVPNTPTLILTLAATYSQTHFYGVWTYGGSSPQGNFSGQVYVNNEKTYLVIPASSCPALNQIGPSGYGMYVVLLADSPAGTLSFQYTCQNQLSLATVTLGNPHIIVPSLIPAALTPQTGKEALNIENSSFSNSTAATLYLRNTGTTSINLTTYYVKDNANNQYSRTIWTGPTISPNGLATTYVNIGASCSACTLQGTAFTFTTGNSYTVVVVTSRKNQFTFTIVR